ncbi:MAG: hypothetical protein NUV93_02455 [Firmicutes bacterium]|jgi:SSS family solute:Na+ symporter|nr:hypothetical protein [Bacillota bacterium]
MNSMASLAILVVGVYSALCFLLGWFGWKHSKKTSEDFFLGSRTMDWLSSFFTLTASFYSAYLLMGAVGFYYIHGFPQTQAIVYVAIYGLAYWLIGGPIHILGKKYGHSSPAQMLEHYYDSKTLGILVSIIYIVYTVPYFTIQFQPPFCSGSAPRTS